jgi:undecaprenyl-diphosphatase
MITFLQAILLGLLQGVTELFPISSLGHTVLVPWLFNWQGILSSESRGESFYLSFVVMLHVGTALALLLYYRHTWVRIIKGFFRSVRLRKIDTSEGRLAWLLLVATIPTAIIGLAFEHKLRVLFSKPLAAIIFLFINGLILLAGDHYQKRMHNRPTSGDMAENVSSKLTLKRSLLIGFSQIGALFAGISRSGITMVAGLYSGLDHEDAARFSFLLATPVILGAGLVKISDFFGPLGAGIRGQTLVAGLTAGIAAYFSVRFLDRYFRDKTLRPFAIYCLCASVAFLLLGFARGHF